MSVYDILKNPTKRKHYDEVLVNGLPNWRSAVYYYRYVRKMGMAEACIILFIIITIGQYIVNWAAYFEKKFTIVSTFTFYYEYLIFKKYEPYLYIRNLDYVNDHPVIYILTST